MEHIHQYRQLFPNKKEITPGLEPPKSSNTVITPNLHYPMLPTYISLYGKTTVYISKK